MEISILVQYINKELLPQEMEGVRKQIEVDEHLQDIIEALEDLINENKLEEFEQFLRDTEGVFKNKIEMYYVDVQRELKNEALEKNRLEEFLEEPKLLKINWSIVLLGALLLIVYLIIFGPKLWTKKANLINENSTPAMEKVIGNLDQIGVEIKGSKFNNDISTSEKDYIGYERFLDSNSEVENYETIDSVLNNKRQENLPQDSIKENVIFVMNGAKGDGSSWENAIGDLQQALSKAQNGDQIWVAAGLYLPTKDTDREISFELVSGVKLYGGFKGNEENINDRNLGESKTILSGAIGGEQEEDNSYTVVLAANLEGETILDGIIIRDGFANGFDVGTNVKTTGAGLFNINSNLIVSNCVFVNNHARNGAAVYNVAIGKLCAPIFEKVYFINNEADFDGGAIYNNAYSGDCKPRIINSVFTKNKSTYGSAIFNIAPQGTISALIKDCVFNKNVSFIRGVIYNSSKGKGVCETKVIVDNYPKETNLNPRAWSQEDLNSNG